MSGQRFTRCQAPGCCNLLAPPRHAGHVSRWCTPGHRRIARRAALRQGPPRNARRYIEVGERVGRLVVTVRREPGQPRVSCRCDCGTERLVPLGEWGKSLSCGCLRIERLLVRNTTHGHSYTSIYLTWSDMVNRCKNSTHHHWEDYGGRGIRVCKQWQGRGGFTVFLADMGERPDGLTLDRIDNDGNYEPDNCRWATTKQQRANQRPHRVTVKTHCVRGHEFTPDNTATTTDGKRRCRACSRWHAAQQRARKAAVA